MAYYETCCKHHLNTIEVFDDLARLVIAARNAEQEAPPPLAAKKGGLLGLFTKPNTKKPPTCLCAFLQTQTQT